MKQPVQPDPEPESPWQKTPHSNLIRYKPSKTYFARFRVRGKLIRQTLKTKVMSVAKLRLADMEKEEREKAASDLAVEAGDLTFADALTIYRQRLTDNAALKPRTKAYQGECISKLLRTWPDLPALNVKQITKARCLQWAATLAKEACPSVFNHTIATLRRILEVAVESASLYDNPARFIKRQKERSKILQLPSHSQFQRFVEAIKAGKVCSCYLAADLVRFLAYGGFRKSEARQITWGDCNFEKSEIHVRGDLITGTKNWEARRVPMIPEMVELLTRLREERNHEKPSERVMKIQECQISMDRAAQEVGMTRITHHDLRHLFATRCIESGVDIPTVSRWLGHKDGGALAMKVYGHLRNDHSKEMASKVSFSTGA